MRFLLNDLSQWHDWFAWHPVEQDGIVYWLETIERRWYASLYDDWWEYRPKTPKGTALA